MNEADYNELLERAKSLMDERDAAVPPSAMPGEISMLGRTLSYEGGEGEDSSSNIPKRYPGDLVLSARKVKVTPFGVFLNNNDYFMAPTISGRSIFDDNPPSLDRRPGGAAVYIESVFTIDSESQARLTACNIVDRALGEPYPIEKGVLAVTDPDDTWTVVTPTAKAYRLLGVYTASGRVYNQTILGYSRNWTYRTTTLDDGRVIPPSRPAATLAPVRINVTFNY